MRLSPRLLFFVVPYFMRAPMKVKIIIGLAAIAFFGWTYLGKMKGRQTSETPERPAPGLEVKQPF